MYITICCVLMTAQVEQASDEKALIIVMNYGCRDCGFILLNFLAEIDGRQKRNIL